jgi:two-component system cell cycle response regulator DivK
VIAMRDGEDAALARLRRLGGQRLVHDLAAIYLDEMPRRMATARDALQRRDRAALADASHAMKSSSAQLGATELGAACEAVEDAADRGDLEAAGRCFAAVEVQYAAFASRLSAQTGASRRPAETTRADDPRDAPVGLPVVAVIEDNIDNRLLLDAMLGDRFALDEYPTGVDALAAMPSRLPDLVLLDVSLPGMDGLEVLARMRHDLALREVPVVAVTAHAMAGDRERYLAAAFDGYVAKPIVDDRVLIDTIEGLLSSRAPRARHS